MRAIGLAGFIAGVGLGLGWPGSSEAMPVTWVFEGRVEMLNLWQLPAGQPDALTPRLASLGVQVGANVSGRVVFEASTANGNASPRGGRPPIALIFSELSIGAYTVRSDLFSGDPAAAGSAFVVSTAPGVHGFLVTQDRVGDAIGLITTVSVFGLQLSSPNLAYFAAATQSVPVDPPELSGLDPFGFDDSTPSGYGSEIYLSFRTELGGATLQSSFTRLERAYDPSIDSVPEPLLLGLLAPFLLAACAWRTRRSV